MQRLLSSSSSSLKKSCCSYYPIAVPLVGPLSPPFLVHNSRQERHRRRQQYYDNINSNKHYYFSNSRIYFSSSSSLTEMINSQDDENDSINHYDDRKNQQQIELQQDHDQLLAPCGTVYSQYDMTPYPDPLPEPKYTFKRRILATSIPRCDQQHQQQQGDNNNTTIIATDTTATNNLDNDNNNNHYQIIPYNSIIGKQYLIDSLINNTSSSYMSLMEHYCNQDDPAYCGITTLMIILNSLYIDPKVIRWKHGWRYFGNENMLISLHPCMNPIRMKRNGINMEQFYKLSSCQGLHTIMKRPINNISTSIDTSTNEKTTSTLSTRTSLFDHNKRFDCTVDEFRNDIIRVLTSSTLDNDDHDNNNSNNNNRIVVSFNRPIIQQTGDGHYSPIAAYHATSDTCLLLDVARFKYQPYWIPIQLLYNAMIPYDTNTNLSRGWFLLSRRQDSQSQQQQSNNKNNNQNNNNQNNNNNNNNNEDCIPAKFVPLPHENNPCPIHTIKGYYCENNKS